MKQLLIIKQGIILLVKHISYNPTYKTFLCRVFINLLCYHVNKKGAYMNTIERLNEVIEYMESHISEDICMDTLAHLYGASLSVLQKTFLNICEITLSEYLRRRRLSNAIFDLRTGDKILDIALRYQYQSGDAFSRAFKQQHGITPSDARKDNTTITLFSRIVFTLSIKGVEAMSFKIERRPAMRIVGYKTFVGLDTMGPNTIPSLWDAFPLGKRGILDSKNNGDIKNIIGVNAQMHDGGFDYWIGVTSDNEALEDGEYCIPECLWVKIEAKGALRPVPIALQETYKRFFREWLPFSNYEHAGYAEIEYYPMMGSDPYCEDYRSEIWISVRGKEKG